MAKKPPQTVPDIEERKKIAKRELQRELMEAVPGSSLAQRKIKQKKLKQRRAYYGLAIAVVLLMGYWLFKPFQSGMPYGICKVFIELYVPYPNTLRYSEVETFADSVRVWFSKVDAFGEYRMEPMQCIFKQPDNGYPYQLKRVVIGLGKREVDPAIVERFNESIPVIVAYPPDLTYPEALPDSLEGLQFDFDAFRKQIFD